MWSGFGLRDLSLFSSKTLKSLLDDYKHFPGLGVHWIFMGPSGHEVRPREGGVLRHYRQCSPKANRHVKTIVNTFYVDKITGHPHNFFYRCAAVLGLHSHQ
jgi:hypothetical protein